MHAGAKTRHIIFEYVLAQGNWLIRLKCYCLTDAQLLSIGGAFAHYFPALARRQDSGCVPKDRDARLPNASHDSLVAHIPRGEQLPH